MCGGLSAMGALVAERVRVGTEPASLGWVGATGRVDGGSAEPWDLRLRWAAPSLLRWPRPWGQASRAVRPE